MGGGVSSPPLSGAGVGAATTVVTCWGGVVSSELVSSEGVSTGVVVVTAGVGCGASETRIGELARLCPAGLTSEPISTPNASSPMIAIATTRGPGR